MISTAQDPPQLASDCAAALFTAALLATVLITPHTVWRAVEPVHANQSTLEVVLMAPAEAPPAPAITPPTPAPHQEPPRHARQRQPAPPVPVPDPAPLDPPASERDSMPEGAMAVAPAQTSSSTAAAASRADAERQYAAGLHADIDRRTRPPDTAQYRLHRPAGEVQVGFIVARSGEHRAVRLLRSSGSSILDDAALVIVSSGHYSPMPAAAFVGETDHAFAVTIEFRAPR